MLRNTKNNSLIINNALEFGEELTTEANGKGRKFVSRFIEAGLAHYEQFGDVLITKETLDKFIQTMVGCPVIIKHKDITDQNADKERVGVVSKVWFDETDGWFYCEGIIWNKQAIDLVKNQGWNVSCTYDFESDFKKGIYHGKDYDMEFTNGQFLHLALVPNPRYERATIVMNSKDNEHWITIKGNHILIKNKELADFLGDEKKSYAQFNTMISVYARANKEDKDLQEEVTYIQQQIKQELEKERIEVEQTQLKKDNAKKTIEKKLQSKNVRVVQYDEDGYNFRITQGDGFGLTEQQAKSLKTYLGKSLPHLEVKIERDYISSKREQDFETRYLIMAMIKRTQNENKNGKWVTIKGNHVFLPEGKEEQAIEEFIDKQSSKKEETKKDSELKKETKTEDKKFDLNSVGEKINSTKDLNKGEKYIAGEKIDLGNKVFPAGTEVEFLGSFGGANSFKINGKEYDISLDDVKLYKNQEKLSSKEQNFIKKQPPFATIYKHPTMGVLAYTPDDDTIEDINGNFYDGQDLKENGEWKKMTKIKKAKNSLADALCEVLAEALIEE